MEAEGSESLLDALQGFVTITSLPEPCCLTWEDFCDADGDSGIRRRYSEEPVFTDEPQIWVEVLFDPGDVIEFRLRPPRLVADKMLPRKFSQRITTRRNGIYPWVSAEEVNVIVNRLAILNHGGVTWWRSGENELSDEAGIPLNVYAGVNPRFATGCGKNKDIFQARNVFVDIDKSTLDHARQRLLRSQLPEPTMTVSSGHGVHYYWRLSSPIYDLGFWTEVQKRLIHVFGSDPAIHDPSRVMRVPGFNNVNGQPTKCYIHEADAGRRYSLEDILLLLPGEPLRIPSQPTSGQNTANRSVERSEKYHQSGDSEKLRRATAYASQFLPAEINRNTTAFERTCALVEKFDLTSEEVLPLISMVNAKGSYPLPEDELKETVEKAVTHVLRKVRPQGVFLEKQYIRVQKYVEPQQPVVGLDLWRKDLEAARLSSLGRVSEIFFDGSATGAGKSTADLVAIKAAGKSAIFLPTHDACEEEAAKLVKLGLSAAAHPPLSNKTCQKFGTKAYPGAAQVAQSAGLNVGQCICPSCEFFTTCDYQRLREVCRNAQHVVSTHARAALSDFESAKDKPIVFIHEDVTNLFRPVVKLVRTAASLDTPQARHLLDILRIAQAAEDVAIAWSDEAAIAFSKKLKSDVNELIAVIDSPELVKEMEDAATSGGDFHSLPSVKALQLKPKIERHDRLDYLLKRAMDSANVYANGPTLKLVLAYSLGELDQLSIVVDDSKADGGKPIFSKALFGVWKVRPPQGSVVWIENASTTVKAVELMVGQPVLDKTPKGRLDFVVAPIQYADEDVTMRTSKKTFRSIVRGLLAQYPHAQKIGIISHRCHQATLDSLSQLWAGRIRRKEYFRSGKDRASNSWLDCDLILVLGTPRVPKHAVRDFLLQLGKVAVASRAANFGIISWEGQTTSGKLKKNEGRSYDDPDWADAHNHLVTETLRQAIGRGRGVTGKGVQVVVVSNESLDLPLADSPLRMINDSEDETLHDVIKLTATNVNNNTLAINADVQVTTKMIADNSSYSLRTVRLHLSSLSLNGLLTKKGARAGWTVPQWLRSGFVFHAKPK